MNRCDQWRACPTTACSPETTKQNCMSCPERPEVKADAWWESLTDAERIVIHERET